MLVHGLRGNRLKMVGDTQKDLCLNAGAAVILIDMQAHRRSRKKGILRWLQAGAGKRGRRRGVCWTESGTPYRSHWLFTGWCCRSFWALPLPLDVLVLESVYPTIEEAIRNRLRVRLGQVGALLTPFLSHDQASTGFLISLTEAGRIYRKDCMSGTVCHW